MDLLKAVGVAEEEGKGSLLLLSRLSSALVKAYANLEMFDDVIDIFFQTSPLRCFRANRAAAVGCGCTYVLVVQALSRNEDTKGVEKLLSRLLNSETRNLCVFYLNFIEGLYLNQMTVEPGKSMFGELICAWCRVKNVRKARWNFNVLVARGIIPDLYTFTIMISTHCRLNELNEAYALFIRMKTMGIKPDVVTCIVLLNIPKLDTKREMKAFDVKPDVVYYTVLIAQQCKIQNLQEAERIFAEMIESGLEPDVVPYTALIAGCCRNGFVHKAVTLMQEMWEKGIEPTKASLSAVHYAILKAKRLRSRK
ncbi:hypothetical protein ARALYDRAFT_888782 [Arabidopsis lyrata subsp. lyrata]|uniref:Pentatricopeptide repeat-containing protein n=1 Tax=Arabidopsis lyrata subsp. lyrata TaxID=81972 RepID=D7KBG6_ARALL|nr:hypothetical protein ARALYDRAFT_888782 [Arabidopsis lyrata subsp. lyrata]